MANLARLQSGTNPDATSPEISAIMSNAVDEGNIVEGGPLLLQFEYLAGGNRRPRSHLTQKLLSIAGA